ncbi:MAG: hypothetical protein H0V01_10400 [Bacteroidetes bacterium]|nr:hypothetical protein [Bacteroidota bacterium]MDQ3190214.1 hypothetical protein [Bacteroidota bacterium]
MNRALPIKQWITAQIRLARNNNSIIRFYNLDLQSNETQFDISQFPTGAYTLTLITDGIIADSKNLMIVK